jgi:glycosyltransferase involved in cell wall biosynthesis
VKALLIHQNFPGQYLYLAQYLRNMGGHEVVGIGEAKNIKARGSIRGITTIGYPTPDPAGEKTHHYLQSTEAAVRRGQAVARSMLDLKKQGFTPDVICVHPGWGEGLFVRDVFPATPILEFCEFYFRAGQADLDFDPEFPDPPRRLYSIRLLNTPQIMSLLTANACQCPTRWQASRYPQYIQEKIHIIHDGVDTVYMQPATDAKLVIIPLNEPGESRVFGYYLPKNGSARPGVDNNGQPPAEAAPQGQGDGQAPDGVDNKLTCVLELAEGDVPSGEPIAFTARDKVITYIGRNLEPYRGFHVFLRAVPELQRLHPDAHILIVGKDGVSYSPTLPEGQTYKSRYMKEMQGKIDLSRVHFLGRIPYPALRAMYCISSAHVYLTYPFVLSWSMLEAMSCRSLVIGSRTPPVEEVIRHGENGLLFNFFDSQEMVKTIDMALREPEAYAEVRRKARETVVQGYELRDSLMKEYRLLQDLAAGKYPTPEA